MTCKKYLPRDDLSPWLACGLEWRLTSPKFIPDIFPGTGAEILFNIGDKIKISTTPGITNITIDNQSAVLLTPRKVKVSFSSFGDFHTLSLRLNTAAFFDIFSIPLPLTIDQVLTLEQLSINYPKNNSLKSDGIIKLSHWLRENISKRKPKKIDMLFQIEQFYKECSIESLRKSVDLHPRQIQRKIHEYVGVNARYLQRTARFQKTLRFLLQGKPILGGALDFGFYDQSHFTKDCVFYTQLTPKKIITEEHMMLNHYNHNINITSGFI